MSQERGAARLQRLSGAFGEVLRCLHAVRRPGWVELDLTMAQFKALMLVASAGGMSGRELAQRLGIGPSAVTPLVDRLVQHGYARREEDASDRRVTWTRPTAAGLALFERVSAAGREGLEEVLALLTPAELDLVEQALGALLGAARRAAAAREQEIERP